jgi:HSP20 family molecular chaperone IbpA
MLSDELLVPGLLPWSLFDDDLSFSIPTMSPWTMLDDCSSRFPVSTSVQGENLLIEVEVPRFKAEELKVEVNPKTGVVRISGDRGKGKPSFRHRLLVSPKVYDVEKHTEELKDGVLIVIIPRKKVIAEPPQEKAGESKHAPKEAPKESSGQVTVTKPTTTEEWPPRLVRQVDGSTTTYMCKLPANVKPEDVQIAFLEHGALRIRVAISNEEKTPNSTFSKQATWETQFPLPKDVHPSAVKAELKSGKLTIVAQAQIPEPSNIPIAVQ